MKLWKQITPDQVDLGDKSNDSYIAGWFRPVDAMPYPSARLARMLSVTASVLLALAVLVACVGQRTDTVLGFWHTPVRTVPLKPGETHPDLPEYFGHQESYWYDSPAAR